ncbi:CDP-diacylglycerol--serine O-phosphatidyltransferase [Halieaceae bacterium IMCC14734]|uniref:CDP-diacylglycerol--serine O-phosphatidyltransferase n=1 Tax=Candidatus Litorirhabdus singularis TaxID=2518993 RepID=A0ABT3TLM8_9GAMM|nr:CDP-diacylglycerol--serine O-phosphatidyltransferase [Candidatus Litorirhabdus singularis]MCX2983190.1 CDP-diacylglycerol--serine O-phosphatidyltransferase [Candidatus Litorirhabdus singularis]
MNEDKPTEPENSTSIDLDILVDEHEEEISVGGKTERHRGVYLLPNLFTTAALFAGFYAIIAAIRGEFEAAAIAICFAGFFDGLDGRVARLTNTSSKFGQEYDSLSDMVSFGVAPALVVFTWGLGELGKFGWSVAFIYVACAALRLARFNAQIEEADSTWFTGLASPAAAGGIAATVWVCHDLGWLGANVPFEASVAVAILTAVIGLLMVVNVPYFSGKGLDFSGRVPFAAILVVVFLFSLVTLDPPKVLLATFVIYASSGPLMLLIKGRPKAPA